MFQGYTDFTMTARKYYKFWPFCIKTFTLGVKWKAKQKYNTIRTIPKSYWKLIERGKLDTPNTQITDRLLSLFDTGNSIKRWGSKKIYKIPESVNRQTIQLPKEKRTNNGDKMLPRKLKIEQHEPTTNRGAPRCFRRVSSSCSMRGIRRFEIISCKIWAQTSHFSEIMQSCKCYSHISKMQLLTYNGAKSVPI